MGRNKLKRNLQFKPRCTSFIAEKCVNDTVIYLLHEELEALYLMDTLELYQADAAEQMNVSRPTFARILKSARQKVTMMLITGNTLRIEDIKEDYRILIPSKRRDSLLIGKPDSPFLFMYQIEKKKITEKKVLDNPVFVENTRPGQILPLVCSKENVNLFISTSTGEGLKSALLYKGIYSLVKKSLEEDTLVKLMW